MLDVLELDVGMLELEVPEVLVLLEDVLVQLVEVIDAEGINTCAWCTRIWC